ncbi:MAG: class II fructose-bisphosphate aldolase [Bacteroidota bacterium]
MIPGGLTLAELLPAAQDGGYAVPAFNPRYRACIRPVVEAAAALRSPCIIQISQRELEWFALTPRAFRDELERTLAELGTPIPFALHLDHAWSQGVIEAAMEAGFTSVMFDGSDRPLAENTALTRGWAAAAHARGMSLEAELGRLTAADRLESAQDEAMYTDPEEARDFIAATGADALAVSIGTAHGVYPVKNPRLDFARLAAIRRLLPRTPLVLHGGSGLPAATVRKAIAQPGGGISKLNVATDLEQALLAGLGGISRLTSAELDALPPARLARGLAAVREAARDKILNCVGSAGRAAAIREEKPE